jgi:hypothetical protein
LHYTVDLCPSGLPLGCIIPGSRNQLGESLLSDDLVCHGLETLAQVGAYELAVCEYHRIKSHFDDGRRGTLPDANGRRSVNNKVMAYVAQIED